MSGEKNKDQFTRNRPLVFFANQKLPLFFVDYLLFGSEIRVREKGRPVAIGCPSAAALLGSMEVNGLSSRIH